jgi:hypothetical protein
MVFLYDQKNEAPFLYVGELSTIAGLSIFPPDTHVSVIEFGAQDFNGYEWATEKELPQLRNIRDLCSFLQQDIRLVNIEVGIGAGYSLSSHDDFECHFTFVDDAEVIQTVEKIAPSDSFRVLIDTLINHPGVYVECDEVGRIRIYENFEEYVAQST